MDQHKENETSPSSTNCCSLRSKISAGLFVGLGIAVAIFAGNPFFIYIWFLGLPLVYLILRYLWLRLCRDPFLSQSDTTASSTWESITNCPSKRTVPTILFWIFIGLCFAGAILSGIIKGGLEPNLFFIIAYNGFGSLLILTSAVWLVDALCLLYLFFFKDKMLGQKGAAQDWWYRNKMLMQEEGRPSMAAVASGNSEVLSEEISDGHEKPKEHLDQQKTGAKMRLALTLVLYGGWTVWSYFAAYNPKILEFTVPVPKLPQQCDGYRLGMAADLHVGTMAGISDVVWMVDNLNALQADAIALVGDIGDSPMSDIVRTKMAPLADLQATDGVYMSFGNHENIYGVEDYRKLLREESPFAENLVLLENQHAILTKGDTDGCSIALVGTADWSGKGGRGYIQENQVAPDFAKAIRKQVGLNGTFVEQEEPLSSEFPMILMQHQPLGMKQAAKNGVGLQISGHTHGGQIFPQHITLLGYDSIAGLAEFDIGSEHGPSYLFVSEGVVGWGPRLRFLSQTDIAVLTLRTPETMKAESLEPDISTTTATVAMYFAISTIPISLILCAVPFCCWARKWRNDRRSDTRSKEGEDDDVDVEGSKDVAK